MNNTKTNLDKGINKSKTPKYRLHAWLPSQHGSWAIILLPSFYGMYFGGFSVAQISLIATWFFGFLFAQSFIYFNRKAKKSTADLLPLKIYGSLSALNAVITFALLPRIIYWLPIYAVFLAVIFFDILNKKEHDLRALNLQVLASCLLAFVSYDIAQPHALFIGLYEGIIADSFISLSIATAYLFAYFVGTTIYVKSLIRKRRDIRYTYASITYHLFITVTLATIYLCISWSHITIFAVIAYIIILFRTLVVSYMFHVKQYKIKAKTIGIIEILLTTLVALASFTL